MKNKKHIRVLLFAVITVSFCQGQVRPKVKKTLDSLYPNASIINLWIGSKTQDLEIKCNCQEISDRLIIIFDTDGSYLYKDIYIYSLKDLPDTIVSYMNKNRSPSVRFDNSYIIKSIDKKGNVYYSIKEIYILILGHKVIIF